MSHAATATPAPSRWIVGPWQDALLFFATPALILPITLALLYVADSAEIRYCVLAFGSMGHNLPGMMRAYGDRALFRRFRIRLLLAPVVFASLCYSLAVLQSNALILIAYMWSVWHALMQIYGFMRIYDAKVASTAASTARLDLLMCAVWFGGAILFSDTRLHFMQSLMVDFGIPTPTPTGLATARIVVVALLGIVSLAFIFEQLRQRHSGKPANSIKNLLVLSSIGFWWYANVATADVLLGVVMFEVFHDVQYLAIVWLYNRRRVETDPGIGALSRFIFRRSWGMLGIYIALVLAYGGFIPAANSVGSSDSVKVLVYTIVTTSALLHYYLDGFIWKVREQSTRAGLGLVSHSGTNDLRVPLHAAKWLFLFVPIGWLVLLEQKIDRPSAQIETRRSLASLTPKAAQAHFDLGLCLSEAGRHAEALASLRRANELLPGDRPIRQALVLQQFERGKDLLRQDDEAAAREHLEAAVQRAPELAGMATDLGLRLWNERQLEEAIQHLRAAVLMQPDLAPAHLNLALAYRDKGDSARALRHARIGARLLPNDQKAQQLLAELSR